MDDRLCNNSTHVMVCMPFPRRRECRHPWKAPTSLSAAETGTQPQMPSEPSLNTLSACTMAVPFLLYNMYHHPFFTLYTLPPPPLCLLLPTFWCTEVSLKPRHQVGGDTPVSPPQLRLQPPLSCNNLFSRFVVSRKKKTRELGSSGPYTMLFCLAHHACY